ncbi:substrate-binding domain-containing protein, partial [Streptomyces sp. SID2131]|nr:substrate-binding domain-containing protein [Streptomyces sp. SID2131]
DDSAVARHMDPPLTSVRQPIEEMGRAMARLLLQEIASPGDPGDQPRRMLPTELVVRESS